ncbi:MAG: histidine phosphatase family protein [Paracoccaceae bacterium]
MKKLILMRHAKSSWSDGDLADVERPLNARGKSGADAVGAWLNRQGVMPDMVISSSASRCQETWQRVAAKLSQTPEVLHIPALYMAGPDRILDVIRTQAKGDTVLLLGHNPGIGMLARDLRVDPAPHHASFEKYPSGATTILEAPVEDWATLDFGMTHLMEYITPKDLG